MVLSLNASSFLNSFTTSKTCSFTAFISCMCLADPYVSFSCGRKGDYYRYLAEFKGADDRKEAADHSLKAYEVHLILFLPNCLS